MNWDEVLRRHGTQAGVKITGGRVVSVLCGGHEHADSVSECEVKYSVPKRRVYANTLRALSSCAAEGSDFTVFYKVQKNQWQDLGRFKVSELDIRKGDVLFRLIQVAGS